MEFNIEQLKIIYGWGDIAENEVLISEEEKKLLKEITEYLKSWQEI